MPLSVSLRINFRLFSTLLFFVICSGLSGGTLKIEFEFSKLPPRTGILYLPEEGNLSMINQLVIDQVNKKFTEILTVGNQGSMVVFKNSDSVDHNIYANDLGAKVFFDVGLAEPGEESTILMNWEAGSVIRIGCKIHPRMRSYIANIPSTHYKILRFRRNKTRYRFKMEGIPDELVQVKIWLLGYVDVDTYVLIGETKVIPLIQRQKRFGRVKLIRESEQLVPEQNKVPYLSEKLGPKQEEPVRESKRLIPKSKKWFLKSNNKATHLSERLDSRQEEPDQEVIPRQEEEVIPNQEEPVHESEKFSPKSKEPLRESEKWLPASD